MTPLTQDAEVADLQRKLQAAIDRAEIAEHKLRLLASVACEPDAGRFPPLTDAARADLLGRRYGVRPVQQSGEWYVMPRMPHAGEGPFESVDDLAGWLEARDAGPDALRAYERQMSAEEVTR